MWILFVMWFVYSILPNNLLCHICVCRCVLILELCDAMFASCYSNSIVNIALSRMKVNVCFEDWMIIRFLITCFDPHLQHQEHGLTYTHPCLTNHFSPTSFFLLGRLVFFALLPSVNLYNLNMVTYTITNSNTSYLFHTLNVKHEINKNDNI